MAYTEQERIAARRATWQKYNEAHRAERAAHNKDYVQKDIVKARRSQMRAQSRVHIIDTQAHTLIMHREPAQRVDPTTEIIKTTF
jgi:hypothetical protein